MLYTFPTTFVRASGFLAALADDVCTVSEFTCDVPSTLTPNILNQLIQIHQTYTLDDIGVLPDLFFGASFLQLHEITRFLVTVLNRLCQYDDVRLQSMKGAINAYWLGSLVDLNVAARVWLELPVREDEEDASCFSSVLMLERHTSLHSISAPILNRIVECTEDGACVSLLLRIGATALSLKKWF